MNLLELAEWMEETANEARVEQDHAAYLAFQACAQKLRAAITEQPLSRKWREESKWYKTAAIEDRESGATGSADFCEGKASGFSQCADDLDAYHDEGRELLRRMVEAVDNFNNTRPEKMVDHVRALGSLLKVTNEASKHLRGDSDEVGR